MMELAPGEGAFTAVGGTGLVVDAHRDALPVGDQTSETSEVEYLRAAAENRGHDACSAREAPGFARREMVAGVEPGGGKPAAEHVLVDGHHDGGRRTRVEAVGGEVVEELAEREPAGVIPVRVVAPSRSRLGL